MKQSKNNIFISVVTFLRVYYFANLVFAIDSLVTCDFSNREIVIKNAIKVLLHILILIADIRGYKNTSMKDILV